MNLQRIQSLEEYKAILSENKKVHSPLVKNCFLMSDTMGKYIGEQRLYYEVFSEGLCVFVDEGKYYNCYYFLNGEASFPRLNLDKTVVVEELDKNGNRAQQTAEIEKKLVSSGFTLLKNNLQLEMNIESSENLKSEIENRYSRDGIAFRYIKSDESYSEAVALWNQYLPSTDIPYEHTFYSEDYHLLGAYDREGSLICTCWWEENGKSTECRHIVTRKDYARRGLASSLMSVWLSDAADHGMVKATSWVADSNDKSIAMHKKIGFNNSGKSCRQYILQ